MRFHLSWWQTLGYVEISWEFLLSLLWLEKKNWCQHAMQNYQYLYESTACWHQFLFLWGWGGGGADLLLTHTTDFFRKDRLLIVLRFAWWCAFLELLSSYQDIIFQMCMIAKPNSGQVMMTLQQQRYPICFFILTC